MQNYFNYFTEIEEQFRKCRSEAVLLSPLDWALVESWKDQGFPLDAVLLGIERAFEKFRPVKRIYRKVNSLAYCSQEVFRAVEESRAITAQGGAPRPAKAQASAPLPAEEVSRFLARCASAVQAASEGARELARATLSEELAEIAATLQTLAEGAQTDASADLETTEQVLTALEEKLNATLLRGTATEALAQLRSEVDRGIVPYRRKMPPPEVDLLERRFLKNRLQELYKIPRLSLFYM